MKKLLLGFALVVFASVGAMAQTWPSRPITVIVPFPPGGAADPIARVLVERMRVTLGQPLIIESVAGAGGSIGAGRVARAAPDGYTISLGNSASHVGAPALNPVQYKAVEDFEPVALIADTPLWFIARETLPAKNLGEMIAWLKANSQKATMATVGAGSPAHLCAHQFRERTGTDFQYVPYRGGAPAMTDMMAGTVDVMCDVAASSLPFYRGGKIKAYAIAAKNRWFATPDIPTVDELGFPGLHMSMWHGIWAPKGTPADIIAKLNASVVDALADAGIRQKLADLGQEIPAREQQTPQTLGALHKAEVETQWPIIKAINEKAQ